MLRFLIFLIGMAIIIWLVYATLKSRSATSAVRIRNVGEFDMDLDGMGFERISVQAGETYDGETTDIRVHYIVENSKSSESRTTFNLTAEQAEQFAYLLTTASKKRLNPPHDDHDHPPGPISQ